MISALEQATLFGIQLGSVAFSFIVMLVMVCIAAGGGMWCLFRIRYWLAGEIAKMEDESRRDSLALTEADREMLRQ